MTELRADTDLMRSTTKTLDGGAQTLGQVASQVGTLPSRAGTQEYSTQLARQMEIALSGASSQARQLQTRVSDLSSRLVTQAARIDEVHAVNLAGATQLSSLFSDLADSPVMEASARLRGLHLEQFAPLWALGGFLGGMTSWISSLIYGRQGERLRSADGSVPGSTQYRVQDPLRLRSEAGLQGVVLTVLGAGTILQLTGIEPREASGYKWLNVRTPDGQTGWVAESYLRPMANTGAVSPMPTSGPTGGAASTQLPGEFTPPSRTHVLDEATPDGKQCAIYAQERRPDLGPVGIGNNGAGNYAEIYADTRFQITDDDHDLREKIVQGDAVVWPLQYSGFTKDTGGWTYGHVAIVERVEKDHVIVSQANWSFIDPVTKKKIVLNEMELPREKLKALYIIP